MNDVLSSTLLASTTSTYIQYSPRRLQIVFDVSFDDSLVMVNCIELRNNKWELTADNIFMNIIYVSRILWAPSLVILNSLTKEQQAHSEHNWLTTLWHNTTLSLSELNKSF